MNRQQARRAFSAFTHRMQQAEPLFDDRFFIQNFAAQRGDIRAQTPGFFHHVLRGTLLRRQIRQPPRGEHAMRRGPLTMGEDVQRRPLFG